MTAESHTVQGTGVVSGYAFGQAAWTRPRPVIPEPAAGRVVLPEEQDAEIERFTRAANDVADRYAQLASNSSGVASEVLSATATLARDRGWLRAATKLIKAGRSAEAAADAATKQFADLFTGMGGLMAQRVTDLHDIRDRVIAALTDQPEPGVPRPDTPIVLLADDLAPADTAALDPAVVLALVTRLGGPTSHTAIIARQLGLPCVVAAHDLASIPEGTQVLVDGTLGTVQTGVSSERAEGIIETDRRRREAVRAWRAPGRTADGTEVQLLANVQDGATARKAVEGQADGVGLFRTELCFLSAQTEPSVDEQARIYGEVFAAFPGRKVVVRTLDAGSDKPVPFANHEDENNPALGVRGIRLNWTNPGLLDRQLDAIAEAARQAGVATPWVMAPMVATIDEAYEFAGACRGRGLKPGIMVEVPSVAVMADEFIAEVDFFSIGTNDLTQYVMAADRLSSPLAALTTPWQPAVLRMVSMAAEAGRRAGKPVGVCGEAAADPLLACVLAGLGITSLSMAEAAIPAVGVQLASVTMDRCRDAARQVLAARNAPDAKRLAASLLTASR
ncbi:phosphoenolpyruvate-utilizing N-terminal domain-containing protein [Brooklawnia cerclae]|uniref:Phosphoenolpyruvate-protein phosphotransferase n=1 Tax=Brooklawnia cerclae TaxID=349934 RepID=A0ABX0SC36_9ACTN|nr:phosphoenolpyruvate--protein phosphotransferase [Brooklawnia cerclae]NIH55947.1 phosphotransferase system enzyme I (PtsI) [Brooklawnia cerclae]